MEDLNNIVDINLPEGTHIGLLPDGQTVEITLNGQEPVTLPVMALPSIGAAFQACLSLRAPDRPKLVQS